VITQGQPSTTLDHSSRICDVHGSCLGDNRQSSAQTGPVGSGQVRLGVDSGKYGLVRFSKAWWNDCETAHEASGEGALRPARMRARPEGQSGLPDRRTGETWFARGPPDERPAHASRCPRGHLCE
jgi:hypothetical protein